MNRAAIKRGFERARRFMVECQRWYDSGWFPYRLVYSTEYTPSGIRTLSIRKVWLVDE